MRHFVVLAFATLLASTAFAETTPSVSTNQTRICESARLSDLERRECRAMFKNASDDAARAVAYRVSYERINGPVTATSKAD